VVYCICHWKWKKRWKNIGLCIIPFISSMSITTKFPWSLIPVNNIDQVQNWQIFLQIQYTTCRVIYALWINLDTKCINFVFDLYIILGFFFVFFVLFLFCFCMFCIWRLGWGGGFGVCVCVFYCYPLIMYTQPLCSIHRLLILQLDIPKFTLQLFIANIVVEKENCIFLNKKKNQNKKVVW
jgi:hypothetical protein